MPKKTIIKKLPSVDNSTPKRLKKLSQKKLNEIKNSAPENMPQLDYLNQQKEILTNALENIKTVEKNIKSVEKSQEKLDVLRIKYRTKYMELAHVRVQSRNQITELQNIITLLKAELVKYCPDDELEEISENITKLINSKHVSLTKAKNLD